MMILILFTFAVFQTATATDHNTTATNVTECASSGTVTALDNIVVGINKTLQDILQNSSITVDVKYHTIFGMTCDDPVMSQIIQDIADDVAVCPELVVKSTVKSLEIGPFTFLDLLENFNSLENFCECKDFLLHVLAIEAMKSDILLSDPGAYYPEVINLSVICMKTSPPTPVNFTNVAWMATDLRRTCPNVFKYTTIDLMDIKDYIINICDDFSPENFTCAMNYSRDQEFMDCLQLVDESVTTPAGGKPRVVDVYDCRRADCVKERMAGCTNNGVRSYMFSVNFNQPERQFQLVACRDVNKATSGPYLDWVIVPAIIYVHYFL